MVAEMQRSGWVVRKVAVGCLSTSLFVCLLNRNAGE